MKNILISLSLLLMLAGCGDPDAEYICHNGPIERPCKPDEITMIDGMRFIIDAVKNSDSTTSDFDKVANGNSNERILLVGEIHTDFVGQIQNLSLLNSILKSGDVILLEGASRSEPIITDCAPQLILETYITLAFQQTGKPYDSSERLKFGRPISKTFAHTIKSYDFSQLGLSSIPCGFWDDRPALRSGISRLSLETRNASMVSAIRSSLKRYDKVAIIAGANHVPFTDFKRGIKLNSDRSGFPNDLGRINQFYDTVDKQLKKPKSNRTFNIRHCGTTKVIRDYLDSCGHTYAELVHKTVVNTYY